jgi:hypothetical protein
VKRLVLILSALSFAAAGCMGDSGSGGATTVAGPGTAAGETDAGATGTGASETGTTETTPSPPITHKQFVRKLDGICRKFNRKVDKINRRYADAFAARDYEKSAEAYEKAERLIPGWNAALDNLEVPPEDERLFRRYMVFVNRIDGIARRQIRAFRQHDEAELNRLFLLSDRTRDKRTNVAIAI